MRFLFIVALAIMLHGCTTTQRIAQHTLSNGVWSGSLTSELISADGSKREGTSDLLIAICKGTIRFWARDADTDEGYSKLGNNYIIESSPDSHLIYVLHASPEQPGWVEMQTYALLEMDSDTAALQWSRAVNNRGVEKTKANRYFFSQGITTIRRVNHDCNERLVP